MGGKHRPGTPRDRALGAELRAIRERAELSLAQVAGAIQWNVSTLSRLERGQRHISPEAVMGLAVVYRLPLERRDELVARAKEPATLGWWDRPPAGVPSDLGALASYEFEAIRMTDWSPGVIPGLLQTPAYAEAVMHDWGVPEHDVHPRLRARRQRQELLNRREVDYTAFVGTTALANQLCSTKDFIAQLRHLITMANRDGVDVRLVELPTSFAIGGWYLMNFDRSGPVALVEHLGSSTFLFDEETDPYTAARRKLDGLALSVRATQDRVEAIIEQRIVGK
ncbi:helix-turn-helix domain-containing protein [Actinokineospora spheciospongiae]|uniref:helix-turn-helix domain-containing protein n=1 Tax=Actinokineospora spheciospongiae TaxID=909613 RepID=UPI000D710A54|nr:helix-turn-helix transcriptional regulator [Actinokineospora spheciospongiae]PWW51972.1 helix-turn-helix protein [Actinokineospora spheciospongiae]